MSRQGSSPGPKEAEGRETAAPLVLEAPAKVNLYLEVVARRPDGYHELRSLMHQVPLCDRLELRVGPPGVRLACPGTDLPADQGNLAWRAAAALLEAAGEERVLGRGVDMVLHKRIPVAAGLGGGSSDAAAALLGLNRLLGLDMPLDALLDLGLGLGADVPFFVRGLSAAWAAGIGERLYPACPLDPCWMVLATPPVAVSTAWVYRNFALTKPGQRNIIPVSPGSQDNPFARRPIRASELFNDLEQVTLEVHPEIRDLKEHMRASGADGALMSGSGPTVFGLFARQEAARACADDVAPLCRAVHVLHVCGKPSACA